MRLPLHKLSPKSGCCMQPANRYILDTSRFSVDVASLPSPTQPTTSPSASVSSHSSHSSFLGRKLHQFVAMVVKKLASDFKTRRSGGGLNNTPPQASSPLPSSIPSVSKASRRLLLGLDLQVPVPDRVVRGAEGRMFQAQKNSDAQGGAPHTQRQEAEATKTDRTGKGCG